jgi:hypothetical protein
VHDQNIVEMNNRFAEKSTQLLRSIACLDPKKSFDYFDEEKLVELAEMYVATSLYMIFLLSFKTNLRHSFLMLEVIQIL